MRSFFFVLLLAVLILSSFAFAQVSSSQESTTGRLTPDFSGMYTFLQDGEFVQINVEDQGIVTGFISRFGDLDSDRGAFLDQFLKDGKTDGKKLDFATNQVHGTWFEFHGVVNRGAGKTPNDDAYFIIQGKLTKYTTDSAKKTSAQSREVTFKSFPQNAGSDAPKRD